MSTNVFPSFNLPNIGYPIKRTAMWKTTVQSAISGFETRISDWTSPLYKWTIDLNALQSLVSANDFATLLGFYNSRQGQFDSWLYQDADSYSVTNQTIGTGNGTTTTFQLLATTGGYIEPILAPNVVSHVYNNGTDSGGWTVSNWGTTTPGVVTYSVAPAAGHAITATFTYYYPCRFSADNLDLDNIWQSMYQAQKLSFQSVRN